MAADRTKALTTPHRIKPTSTNRHSAWRPNPGRRSTYRGGDSVQTTGTGSVVTFVKAPDRGRTRFQPLLGLEPCPNLVERQIRLRCDQIKQPLAMRLER